MTTVLPADAKQLDQWFAKVNKLPTAEREAMLKWARAELVRGKSLKTCPSPAYLAKSVDPDYTITPAIALVSAAVEKARRTRRGRLVITMGPQEGKTELVAVWTVIRQLQDNMDTRIISASYSQDLAEQAASRARNVIAAHGSNAVDPLTKTAGTDKLGLALASDKAAASHWRIQGHRGGLIAVGLGGTITGRPADLLIIDDPLKGMQAADSPAERAKIISAFQGDLTTRLAPGAPIILIQTRWNEKDLAGWLLENEKDLPEDMRTWTHVNIPALSHPDIPDALNRPPGVWLESSRGRTVADWEATRKMVGERVFSALYQGIPTPIGGGLFSTDDFDRYRRSSTGPVLMRLVSIDPAETGRRDEAGLIGAAADGMGHVMWTHDWSGHMQSDQWSRKAVILALTIGASVISFEAYTTEQTYSRVIRDAWKTVRNQARILAAAEGDVDVAALILGEMEDPPADPLGDLQQLVGLTVPDQTDPPFQIKGWRGQGDKTARAIGAMQAAATGRLQIVGTLPTLEKQASTWQLGQSSPDRMDAAVNAYEHLVKLTGAESVIVTPQQAMARRESQAQLGSPLASPMSRPITMTDRP